MHWTDQRHSAPSDGFVGNAAISRGTGGPFGKESAPNPGSPNGGVCGVDDMVRPAPGIGGGLFGIIGSNRAKSDGPPDAIAAIAAIAAKGGGTPSGNGAAMPSGNGGIKGGARGSGTPARPRMLTDAGLSSLRILLLRRSFEEGNSSTSRFEALDVERSDRRGSPSQRSFDAAAGEACCCARLRGGDADRERDLCFDCG